MEKNIYPFISALLVTYNESKYIQRALESFLNQDYPHDLYEVIIIDGGSTDNTIELAKKTVEDYSLKNKNKPLVSYINNTKKILASGWNLGIQHAKGKYVVRIDAHAVAASDFLRLSVETILRVDAVCVGGKLVTKADTSTGEIITNILSSTFGVGNSSFRTNNKAGYADTAVYGLYKKEIFNKAGFFDESLVRNQDVEMHSRIKRIGGKFYFNPKIVSIYYSRDTIKKMLKQAYGNGMWNMLILRKNHAKLSLRHLVPFFFLVFLLSTTLIGFICPIVWTIEGAILCLYFLLAGIASIIKTKNIVRIIKMIFLFPLLHIFYGAGSLIGIIKSTNSKSPA